MRKYYKKQKFIYNQQIKFNQAVKKFVLQLNLLNSMFAFNFSLFKTKVNILFYLTLLEFVNQCASKSRTNLHTIHTKNNQQKLSH